MADPSRAKVTVVDGEAWVLWPQKFVQLLAAAAASSVIPNPAGLPANPDRMVMVSHPRFWAGQAGAMSEALAANPEGKPPIAEAFRRAGQASGTTSTTKEGRLTLTVEEALALLGISRALPTRPSVGARSPRSAQVGECLSLV